MCWWCTQRTSKYREIQVNKANSSVERLGGLDNGALKNIRRSDYINASPYKLFKSGYTTSALLMLQLNLLALLALGKYVRALKLPTSTITSCY